MDIFSVTIAAKLKENYDSFTRAEVQLVGSLLNDYPVSALGSITTIAENAKVSTPTVARMIKKIGFSGFSDFRSAIRDELAAMISNPMVKRETQFAASNTDQSVMDSHFIDTFAKSVQNNIEQTLRRLDRADLDSLVNILTQSDRNLYILGGRVTCSLAEYFFTHLQVIRPNVHLISSIAGVWAPHVLNMQKDDVLLIIDIRRYENLLLKLANIVNVRGIEIVLFTDQWGSPISKLASHSFNCNITAPSAWDSSLTILFALEALVSEVQNKTWETSKERMKELEYIFDQTRLFRKFV
ncbi:MAG: MurR/RpiR family transcriptional regulator [Cocleimonas sp.]